MGERDEFDAINMGAKSLGRLQSHRIESRVASAISLQDMIEVREIDFVVDYFFFTRDRKIGPLY